jgi:hypothetical protein
MLEKKDETKAQNKIQHSGLKVQTKRTEHEQK